MLSFVINNVRSRTITSTTSTCISKFNATSSSLLLKQQHQQQRSYWREVLRVKSYNPKAETNKIIYEDPSTMAERSSRAQAGEGMYIQCTMYSVQQYSYYFDVYIYLSTGAWWWYLCFYVPTVLFILYFRYIHILLANDI